MFWKQIRRIARFRGKLAAVFDLGPQTLWAETKPAESVEKEDESSEHRDGK